MDAVLDLLGAVIRLFILLLEIVLTILFEIAAWLWRRIMPRYDRWIDGLAGSQKPPPAQTTDTSAPAGESATDSREPFRLVP